MNYRTIAEDWFDAQQREHERLKGAGLDHVEAHLIGQWRLMSDDQRAELLKAWRRLLGVGVGFKPGMRVRVKEGTEMPGTHCLMHGAKGEALELDENFDSMRRRAWLILLDEFPANATSKKWWFFEDQLEAE